MPFAFGHAFRQGDVPAGSVAIGNVADWQCTPLTFWPDGSVKHAIIAGRASFTAGSETSIALSAGPSPAGSVLTESDLAAALPEVTITVGAHTTRLNSLVNTSARHTTVCVGPVMSNWIYRQPVSGSNHLVVWCDVRFFKGGAIEIFPWVENGYLLVAGPANAVVTATVTIGGTQRFSRTIDIKHHTRIPLIEGSSFSYWVGADPGITPRHDRNYLLATKLVPNLGYLSPSGATLDGLQQTYAPNTLAGDENATGSAGGRGDVIARPAALYLSSGGDVRAWRGMMVHALSSGSWASHYRDETTNYPLKPSNYPNIRIYWLGPGTPSMPQPSGGGNATDPSPTHLPSYAYLPFLLTGRWWFLEEAMFWATYCYMVPSPSNRSGASGIVDATSSLQARGAAWSLNCYAQALAICPTSYPLFNDLKSIWEANMAHYRAKYVDGSSFGGSWVSPQGFLGEYAANGTSIYPPPRPSSAFFGQAWQNNYLSVVFGYTSDLALPQSATSAANHLAIRNHGYKQQVGRADDGQNGRYNWRRFIVFSYPIGTDGTGLPVDSWFTAAQSYTEYLSAYGLASIPATEGLTLKVPGSDSDMTAGISSLAYGDYAVAALALAVDHGAPGAAAGYRRVTTASNFASTFTAYLNNEAPQAGIVPRG